VFVVFVKMIVTRLPARLEELTQPKCPSSKDNVHEGLGGGLGGGEGGSPLDASGISANEFEPEVMTKISRFEVEFEG